MAGERAAPRLLLIVLIAVGVASMHTLGHPAGGGHGGAAHPAAHGGHQPPAISAAHETATMVVAARDTVLRGMGMTLDPSTMCLAILVAFALAVLLAALLAAVRRRLPAEWQRRGTMASAGRGPPQTIPLGLRVTNLSILRI
ncbi:DUF6153 family protein [Actinomycetes bacterium KLBMP 9797]